MFGRAPTGPVSESRSGGPGTQSGSAGNSFNLRDLCREVGQRNQLRIIFPSIEVFPGAKESRLIVDKITIDFMISSHTPQAAGGG